MTAEVAILNSSGVALAADSAVTIGDKVYNSVNKLFTLSKIAPVGIMVYNSADVMTMPVETVIKEFRRQLGDAIYDTLDEYCAHFLEFLKSEGVMFSQEAREEDYVSKVRSVLLPLRKSSSAIARERGAAGDDAKAIAKAVQVEVRKFLERLKNFDFVDGAYESDVDTVVKAIEHRKTEIFEAAVEQTPLTAALRKSLLRGAASLYVKEYRPLQYTGIVIAGFGESEFLPQLRSFHFYGSSFGVTRIEKVETVSIGGKNKYGFLTNASIIGFAQSDMVKTFTDGMAPEVVDQATRSVRDTFRKIKANLNGISDDDRKLAEEGFDSVCDDVVKNLMNRLINYSVEAHYLPTIRTVEGLPKEDLARMAESLVSITSLKRKATGKLETVGGPIDVAIISKGDGFVFTQRKHYFDPKLNPAFVHNYFRTL